MDTRLKFIAVMKISEIESLKEFAEEGLGLRYATVRRFQNGESVSRASIREIEKALEKYCVEEELSNEEIERLAAEVDLTTTNKNSQSKALFSGYWLLVQFRGRRSKADEDLPPEALRTAILKYDKAERDETAFFIHGQNTRWTGKVTRFDQDRYFYVATTEKPRPDEKLSIIMARILDREGAPYHFGILLGIAAGAHDRGRHPVYASRVLLQQIPDELVKKWSVDQNVRKPDRAIELCGYSDEEPLAGILANSDSEVAKYLRSCHDRFQKSFAEEFPENYGGRMFVGG